MRIGIAHHYGWAVAVTADGDHRVADRRRIELLGPDLPPAPVHHVGGPHELHADGPPIDDAALAALVAEVRASAMATTAASLAALAAALSAPVVSLSVRAWPADFPTDIATQRRAPYESRADSVMYLQVVAEAARDRGWEVHLYDAKDVEARATQVLGGRAHEVLHGPKAVLGPPWTKDHRTALAATVLAR